MKHAEAFLAKLPSISLEGLDQLGAHSSVKLQMAPCEDQGYKVSSMAPFTPSSWEGLLQGRTPSFGLGLGLSWPNRYLDDISFLLTSWIAYVW